MRSRLLRLWSLGLLAIVGAAADTSCVDCEATLVANSDWSNGVLAEGNYYQPTKTGNWLLGRSSGGEGPLELRNDPTNGHYVWNFWYVASRVFVSVAFICSESGCSQSQQQRTETDIADEVPRDTADIAGSTWPRSSLSKPV